MMIHERSKVIGLNRFALKHRAINHPYLTALAAGNLPQPRQAIADFAVQYQGYTSWFPKYLTCVMSKLESDQHRAYFQENLEEESGNLDEETIQQLEALGIQEAWVQGIPHPILFRRFQVALGIDARTQPLCTAAILWRKKFRMMLERATACEAIGAMGLGTESMVKYIYRPITTAIQKHTDLDREAYVFFELHSEVDDEHAELMMKVADDLAQDDPRNIQQIQRGMEQALELRAEFWDAMLIRARTVA